MGTKNNPGDFDCYAAAEPDEPMFVLLARDEQAPQSVRQWAFSYRQIKVAVRQWDERAQLKYSEALDCANNMETWGKEKRDGS